MTRNIERLSKFCVALLCAAFAFGGAARADVVTDNWEKYAAKFVQADGRVVDTGADGMSHSESEGTAMLLAERANDRERFDKIWDWTRANLGSKKDNLFIWGWRPNGRTHEPDKNNATDGDTLIAWALAEAADRWHADAYRKASAGIAKALILRMKRDTVFGPVLLPGSKGFENKEGLALNLSYMILPAYPVLDKVYTSPIWKQLIETTHKLDEKARMGRFSLPPDWIFIAKPSAPVKVTGKKGKAKKPEPVRETVKADPTAIRPWSEKPARFGYEAIRVPLYLAWSGSDGRELWPFLQFWNYFDKLPFHPAWFDVKDDSVTLSDMPRGFVAVRRLAEQATKPDRSNQAMPEIDGEQDYYSASLIALSTLALQDRLAAH